MNQCVTSFACLMGVLVALEVQSIAMANVLSDAPESEAYELVYELSIPDSLNLNTNEVPYAIDNTQGFTGTFDRVAYHLELQRLGEERTFIFASHAAHVLDIALVGVPTVASGLFFQGVVTDLKVTSNHPELSGLSAAATGVIEAWPGNYMTANEAGIPGASDDLYDHGDWGFPGLGYGSMQLHDLQTGTTLFAYNGWGRDDGPCDLGVGGNPALDGHPDWTFSVNCPDYSLKTLRVFVRPGPTPAELYAVVQSPQAHQIVQRRADGAAEIVVSGELRTTANRIEARVIGLSPDGQDLGLPSEWRVVEDTPSGDYFYGLMEVPAGWFRMEVRLLGPDDAVMHIAEAGPFGVGEVILTAGQSNSANSGEVPLAPLDPRVSAWGYSGWGPAVDPQPIATGTGGSPWPHLGDLLASKLGVPIGFYSIGWGGTSVSQWRPQVENGLFNRFRDVFHQVGPHGLRFILWHQGESDVGLKQSHDYAAQLEEVIVATRVEAGWDIPWAVARASFVPGALETDMDQIAAGQDAVIQSDPLTFAGPNTDELIGELWRYDGIHFNEAGLIEHAERWSLALELPCAAVDICNGLDDDCDGQTDEGTCDDGFICTTDSCDAVLGCVHTLNSAPCDDSNACTMGDVCAAGQCTGMDALDCDDGNTCTTDRCEPAVGCVHETNEAPCDDDNVCTLGDRCHNGACAPGPDEFRCDDGRACTDDACVAEVGCVFTPRGDACGVSPDHPPDTSERVEGEPEWEDVRHRGTLLPQGDSSEAEQPSNAPQGCTGGEPAAPSWPFAPLLLAGALWVVRRRKARVATA